MDPSFELAIKFLRPCIIVVWNWTLSTGVLKLGLNSVRGEQWSVMCK